MVYSIKPQIKSLYQDIEKCPSFDSKKVLSFSEDILNFRVAIEEYKKNNNATIFEEKTYKCIASCEKKLDKMQSILLKKFNTVIENEKRVEFYGKIEEVWRRVTAEQSNVPNLGSRLFKSKKKDPIVLIALNEYLKSLEGIPVSKDNLFTKPIFHQTVPADSLAKIQECEEVVDSCSFYIKIASLFADMTGAPDIDDPIEFGKKFLSANKDHPLVLEAMNAFIVEVYLNCLIHELEGNKLKNSMTIGALYSLFPEFLLKSLPNPYLKLLNPSSELLDQCLTELKAYKEALLVENEQISEDPARSQFNPVKDPFYSVCTVIDPRSTSEKLKENSGVAKEGLLYVMRKIQLSSNFFNRPETPYNLDNFTEEGLYKIFCSLRSIRRDLVEKKCASLTGKIVDELNSSIIYAKIAEIFRLQNCAGMSVCALYYIIKVFKEQYPDLQVKIIYINKKNPNSTIKEGDHFFLHIGNGGDAVVCDVWDRMIYPARFIPQFLTDYCAGVSNGLPKVKKFDSQSTYLRSGAMNFFTVDDFEKRYANKGLSNTETMKKLLEAFHRETTFEKKQAAAQQMHEAFKADKSLAIDFEPILNHTHFFLTSKRITEP